MTSSPITLWQMNGEKGETVTDFIFLGSKITMDIDCSHEMADKGPYSQNYGFPDSHVQMWKLDHEEGWVLKNWCFWIVVLEKTLERTLDCKEIKPVNPKKKSTLNIHWKDWHWSSNTSAICCEEPSDWKRTWCWERLKAKEEGGSRGWDGEIASPTQWTWIWTNSKR